MNQADLNADCKSGQRVLLFGLTLTLTWFKAEHWHMKTSFLFKSAGLALVVGTASLTGCAMHRAVVEQPAADQEVVVNEPPPQPMVENMTMTPGPGFVWVQGAWSWRGQWVWDQGHWAHPPQPGAVWVAPRYEKRGDKHVFIRGGWRY